MADYRCLHSIAGSLLMVAIDEVLALRTRHLTLVVENLYQAHNGAAVPPNVSAFRICTSSPTTTLFV